MARPAQKIDGRHARKARTREAIVEGLLSLLDEGVPEPTAAQIALRAGVAVRSIAQHFRTREQLMLALATRHIARQPSPPKDALEGPLEPRLAAFVAARARELETSRAMRRAAMRAADSSEAIAQALADVARRRRAALLTTLGPELKQSPPWVRHAVEALTSGPTWDSLRSDQHLSATAAETLVAQSVRQLLRP